MKFVDESDWFAVDTFSAINTSFMESGIKQRLIFLDSGDQTTMMICALPDTVEEIVEKYF